MTVPWTLLLSAFIGMWLMAAPDVLGMTGVTANGNHLVGAAIVAVAVIAMAEVTRAVRLLNVPLGIWIVVAPWLLGGASSAALVSNLIGGAAVLLLSLPRGEVREQYGAWRRYIV